MTDQPAAAPTPGPWDVDGTGCIRAKDYPYDFVKLCSPWREGSWENDPEALANARLIAASWATAAERDRLLVALEDIVRGSHRCKSPGELMTRAQNIARAALDEARQS